MKTQEVPLYLRGFNSIFSYFDYSHSPHTVWNDFLNLTVCGLSYGLLDERRKTILSNYRDEEQPKLWELFECLVGLYADAKKAGEWIDPLGDYYEILSSKGNKQWFGQFFTPHTVCEIMAHITIGNDSPIKKKCFDPACGSGRLLLAINHLYSGNYVFGCDLDKTCVLMTAINLCLQGAKGEVCWKNSLDLKDHRLILSINMAEINGEYLPAIVEIDKEQSESVGKPPEKTDTEIVAPKKVKTNPKTVGQTSLF
jgi:type I restriction enzyme M protein